MRHGFVKTAAALLLGALGLASAEARAGDCGGRPCIHAGAFNIKLLGTSGPADTAAEYREIGRLVAVTMALDVLVLEEINVNSPQWRDLRAELDRRGYAIAFESAFGGENKQHIVIAYRRGTVELTGPAPRDLPFPTRYAEAGTSCAYDNVRPPVTAAFKAGAFDFRVVGVHLKSQRPAGGDLRCDDRIRADQASKIVGHIAGIAGEERDVIVLGDFNSKFPASENDPFRSAGLRSAMEDLATGSGDISFVTSPRELIDQIVVRRDDPSYVRASGHVYRLAQEDRRFYTTSISDHVPIRASFYTDRDED